MGSVWIKRCDRCDAPFISPGSGTPGSGDTRWVLGEDKKWIHGCDDGYAGGVEEVPVGTPKNDTIQAAKDRIVTDEDAFREAGTFGGELSCSNAEDHGVQVEAVGDPMGIGGSYKVVIAGSAGVPSAVTPFAFKDKHKAEEFATIATDLRIRYPGSVPRDIARITRERLCETIASLASKAAAATEIPTFKYAKVEANTLAGLGEMAWAVRVDGHPPATQLVATKKEAIRLARIASWQCEAMGSQRAAGHAILREARKIARLRDEAHKERIKERTLKDRAASQAAFEQRVRVQMQPHVKGLRKAFFPPPSPV